MSRVCLLNCVSKVGALVIMFLVSHVKDNNMAEVNKTIP